MPVRIGDFTPSERKPQDGSEARRNSACEILEVGRMGAAGVMR